MITEQLLTFIREQLQAGVSRDVIAQMLTGQGWSALDIQQVFAISGGTPHMAYFSSGTYTANQDYDKFVMDNLTVKL